MRNPRRLLSLPSAILAVSMAIAAPPARADDCIPIENFSAAKVGEFPAGWKVRKDEAKKTYTVQEESGSRFLRAHSVGLGQQAARSFEWNLDEYPILAWRWRPMEFPKNGDERESSRNDSVLAVYLLVPYSTIRGPRAVKYIWSEKVPTGTRLESNMGLTKVRVLRSGTDGKGTWTDERVDVRSDFLSAFELEAAPKPGGIAVLTDADETSSSATGDYADFRACRK
ncbi:MAG TPA: DUF3047 domain-containing protein [Candidatus Limnocylindrales bacterium]|nr:DUF3047 domain-containing protein [Candidatus Limnocylindrales bacterium]